MRSRELASSRAAHVADIDAPIPAPSAAGSSGPSAEQIAMIADMGFTPNQARKALRESVSIYSRSHTE